jgi:hypothetical protein
LGSRQFFAEAHRSATEFEKVLGDQVKPIAEVHTHLEPLEEHVSLIAMDLATAFRRRREDGRLNAPGSEDCLQFTGLLHPD